MKKRYSLQERRQEVVDDCIFLRGLWSTYKHLKETKRFALYRTHVPYYRRMHIGRYQQESKRQYSNTASKDNMNDGRINTNLRPIKLTFVQLNCKFWPILNEIENSQTEKSERKRISCELRSYGLLRCERRWTRSRPCKYWASRGRCVRAAPYSPGPVNVPDKCWCAGSTSRLSPWLSPTGSQAWCLLDRLFASTAKQEVRHHLTLDAEFLHFGWAAPWDRRRDAVLH